MQLGQGGTPAVELATADIVVIAAYFVLIVGIGFWVGRGKKKAEGFFLGERGSTWVLVGFSLMAANFGGTHFLGLAGAGYHDGIAVWSYEWMATLVLIFFALFILPFYLRSRVNTLPEFLERRYDRRSRYAFSGFTVFTALFIEIAGDLYAMVIIGRLLFPDVPLWMLASVVAFGGGVYVIAGGLRAVMITDTIDGVFLLLTGGVIFFLVYQELGSWQAIKDAAPHGLSIVRPPDDDFLPWPGIFTGVLWLGLYYWLTNHIVVQKALSAKSIDHGRWGALFAGAMQLPFLFLLILPGTMGRVLYPDLEEPDQVWAVLILDFLPAGLRAIALAALIAALTSTLDSVLNGAASLVVNDFIKTRKKEFTDRQLLLISRVLIGVFMVLAAVWAPQILRFEGIVEYFQAFFGHITMPVVVILLGGLFWQRATHQAAFYTLVIAAPLGFAAFLASEIFGLYDFQFLYATGVMLLFSTILFIAITLMTEAPEREKIRELVWSRRYWQEESEELRGKPLWKNYRVHALVLAAITLGMVAFFI